jgi:DNA-binding transcriptional MocR family regulator
MPEEIDSLQLYDQARKIGISIAPGMIFSIEGKFRNCIRLNAACWDSCVEGAIETLGRQACDLLNS